MELNVYDIDLTPLGVVDEIDTLIWTRRYWKCGSFKLLVPWTEINAKLLKKEMIIIPTNGRKEAAQIKYLDISKNIEGVEQITLEGDFVAGWLDKRIILNQIVTKDNTQNILYRIVRENCVAPSNTKRKIPLFSIAQSEDVGSGIIDYSSDPYISCREACESAALAAKLGFAVETDVKAKQHHFKVYKGRELTADQNENPPCIFSKEFDNVLDEEYTNSIENLKTMAYVGGEEKEGIQRKIVEVGGDASGMDRDEVFVNASSISQTYKEGDTEITMTDSQYIDTLFQNGASELEQFAETLSFDSAINTESNLVYGEDFDLGDRVTCKNTRWGIKINVRVTEITETYAKGKQDIEVDFGESLPTLIDKIRKVR